ncbi:alcohol dehydrogenase [Bacillus sp. FJAT-27225]|uniref:zinc-dependent alcohol dehydrogenase n=1 Tax=Bacillus sp. FJAT-27225 TaxID=1743144 RepID=UPI00080C2F57|nr:zinc-binding alcohol dehydrogenase [Bacillus sp. FJAT-27225]OCA85867.1 alcohol dehydrogenase [Bacillus sp. FJAT-27225]
MKRIVARNKKVEIIEDAMPALDGKPSYVLIKTMYSVISPGTELAILSISENKQVHLGYSAMGEVVECGTDITDVKKGDLVACYGAPYVHHDEYLLVPKTLYAKVPESVDPKEAALGGLGAIAIHALRIANLQFGETVVIVGLGVLGQLIAKIAHAAALNVIAYDLSKSRVDMLKEETIQSFASIEEMEEAIQVGTKGHGADAVLLCAGGKRSPLTQECLKWIRKKGKAVIVGDIEPDFPRELMFSKEAELLISRAGGPGRYDTVYEREAIDYPYEYVRWTEGRNVEEYIRLIKEKRIDVEPFIKETVELEEAPKEFEKLFEKDSTTLTKLIHYK